MPGSEKRRASAVLHISPDCLERLRVYAERENVTMGQFVEILLDERDKRERRRS